MGQTNQRYLQMLYAHEMVHLVTDKKHINEKDEKYIIKRRDEFSSSDDLRANSDDVGQMVLEDRPTVSDLSKFLNLASAGLYMVRNPVGFQSILKRIIFTHIHLSYLR